MRSYLRVLTHRLSLACILVGGAAVFAYVTGSSLFFIGIVRLTAGQYGQILSACSVAVMSGAFLDGYLGHYGVSARRVLMDRSFTARRTAMGMQPTARALTMAPQVRQALAARGTHPVTATLPSEPWY
ncbi:hypothetical protein [Bradyrhizobium elkanii]|uniref:hypothetical protein n=1 Tax=Bradyrhizobium elkanii TaxID=29448 RepID=UPI000841A7F7|nr:hypothetical protein [Bradyrhizobium elkanii]ODM77101.1 hypothetical protein A6X20_02880 [Bradyrhizobium elkanii]ODM84100.1 hypothetical protein A6452_15005 [Bradyrhizobium elkanii]